MNHDSYPDGYIRGILNTVKSIAMVGVSPKDNRPSYFAFKYLAERGYTMIPVNPGQAGKEILGRKVYARLADIPEPAGSRVSPETGAMIRTISRDEFIAVVIATHAMVLACQLTICLPDLLFSRILTYA